MDGWVDGWTGTGLPGWKGSLGWTIARFVEKLEPTAEAKASPTSERRRLLDAASTSEAATLTGEEEGGGRIEVLAWQWQWQWRGLERQTDERSGRTGRARCRLINATLFNRRAGQLGWTMSTR